MTLSTDSPDREDTIATLENRERPGQTIAIKYLREQGAFVTSGIEEQLGRREILIPVHLVAADLELIGNIIAAILERISVAHETDRTFEYASRFEIMGKGYTLTDRGEYVNLDRE